MIPKEIEILTKINIKFDLNRKSERKRYIFQSTTRRHRRLHKISNGGEYGVTASGNNVLYVLFKSRTSGESGQMQNFQLAN